MIRMSMLALLVSAAAGHADDYREFKGHTGVARIGLFTPDGKTMVTTSGWPGGDGTVRVWDVATGKELRKMTGHQENIDCMAMSPDGKFVYSGGGSGEGTVRGWDVATAKEVVKFEGHGKGQNVSCVLVSPDGKTVASGGSAKKFFLWDAKSGKTIHELKGHADLVRCLAFTPDGKTLISGSWDGTVKVWDTATGKEKSSFKPKTKWVQGLAMLPDGKRVVVACDEFSLWDFTTGEKERTYSVGSTCVAISPDGKTMVSGFYDGKVNHLKVGTGEVIAEYQAHQGHIHGLSFSPDGKWFSTAGGGDYVNGKEVKGNDFAVRIWKVDE